MRKSKLKNLRKTVLNKATEKAVRAHLRRRKAMQSKKAEAPAAGDETPLAAGAAGVEAPAAAGDETPLPKGESGEAPASPEPVSEAKAKAVVKVEPPASPEPVPEAAEAALWPEAGVKVAVGVEHLQHSLRLGETGVSEGPSPDDAREVIVRLDSASVLSSLRIPGSLLVPIGAAMRNMRLWDKCSEGVKRDLLLKLGVRDPRDEVLPSEGPVVLTAWGEYMEIGLRLDEKRPYKFVSPFFIEAFEFGFDLMQTVESGEYPLSFGEIEDQCRRQEMRQKLLRDWWAQHEVLLVSLCDEASGSLALLALRKEPVSVRLYEVSGGRLWARLIRADWFRGQGGGGRYK